MVFLLVFAPKKLHSSSVVYIRILIGSVKNNFVDPYSSICHPTKNRAFYISLLLLKVNH